MIKSMEMRVSQTEQNCFATIKFLRILMTFDVWNWQHCFSLENSCVVGCRPTLNFCYMLRLFIVLIFCPLNTNWNLCNLLILNKNNIQTKSSAKTKISLPPTIHSFDRLHSTDTDFSHRCKILSTHNTSSQIPVLFWSPTTLLSPVDLKNMLPSLPNSPDVSPNRMHL